MNRTLLEILLPAFIIVFLGIVYLWARLRKRQGVKLLMSKTLAYKNIRTVDTIFKIILGSLTFIIIIYAYFPDHYNILAPIDFLDHPVINTIGVLILKVSIPWIVFAQLNIDKAVFMIKQGIDEWGYNKLMLYSEKLMLSGMLMMFIGLFVTISNGFTIMTSIVGFGLYHRLIRLQ